VVIGGGVLDDEPVSEELDLLAVVEGSIAGLSVALSRSRHSPESLEGVAFSEVHPKCFDDIVAFSDVRLVAGCRALDQDFVIS
jgi:hypothetical protein